MGLHVLVTGAYGNIGRHVLRELVARGHRVRAFDLPSAQARRDAAALPGAEPLWGDLRRRQDVERAVDGVDAVVHLAFVLPPRSETDPALSHAVNVGGAEHLVAALEARRPEARLLVASSYAIHGDTRKLEGLVGPGTPIALINHYNRHKAAVEEQLRASKLRWAIFRLGVVLSAEMIGRTKVDPRLIFDLPADCRQEFVHGADVALAFARALEVDEALGKVLMIGGGAASQVYYLDLINRSLAAMGIGPLPKEAFSTEARQGGGWMDTNESQRLLGYQRWTLEAHLQDVAKRAGLKRSLAKVLSPIVRWYLVRASPYSRRAA